MSGVQLVFCSTLHTSSLSSATPLISTTAGLKLQVLSHPDAALSECLHIFES